MEKKGLVKLGDLPLTLIGDTIKPGDKLPEVNLTDQELNERPLKSYFGKILIVNTVPSLDTPVCDAQTRRFNREATELGEQVQILVISNDLPFAQKRYCAAEGIDRVEVLSDYRGQPFGRAAGLFIKENYLLARAVMLADKEGIVRYLQIVPDLGQEPDYDPVIQAVKDLLPE